MTTPWIAHEFVWTVTVDMPSVSVDSNARHTDSQYVNVPKAEGYVPRNHVALQDTTEAYE